MSERCVASTFLSFRNYLQSRQYKTYECQQSFFLLPSPPPFSFLSRVVCRLMGVQKTRFRCRSGQNGQIFRSHLFKNPGRIIASNCCQMAKNDRILADERPLEHFLAILAHFMPIYTRIFENGTARLRCPSGVSRALFCRSETISKVGNIKLMSASSPFFFSPLSPPFSFLSRVVCRLMGVQKTRFRCRSGQNGQIFRSHLFKNPGRIIASNCCQMAKNDRILADERPLEHFLAILAHFMPIYTRIFENGTARLRCPSGVSRALFCRSETISKVGNIKIMSASSPFFFSPLSPPFSFLSRVVCRLMGVQKTRFRCRSGQNGQIFRSHLFKNPGRIIASNCCQMAKNDRILADERPLEHFLAILAHFMPIYTRIFENGTARLRCPSGVSRALFCRSETISKVGNIKIMSASSPFFFSPLSPPFSFSPVWFVGSWESKKPGFGVVPAKMGKSSGATFSKIQVELLQAIVVRWQKMTEFWLMSGLLSISWPF